MEQVDPTATILTGDKKRPFKSAWLLHMRCLQKKFRWWDFNNEVQRECYDFQTK